MGFFILKIFNCFLFNWHIYFWIKIVVFWDVKLLIKFLYLSFIYISFTSYLENFFNEYLALIINFFIFFYFGEIVFRFNWVEFLFAQYFQGSLVSGGKRKIYPLFLPKQNRKQNSFFNIFNDIFIQFWRPFTNAIGGL